MSKTHNFEIDGLQHHFTAVSGTVLSTESRSDTHVSGHGSMSVYNGSGGGSSYISSDVVITRDIWVTTDEGKEANWRYNIDIPVRQGQRLHSITPFRGGTRYNEMFLYNSTTENYRTFYTYKELMAATRRFRGLKLLLKLGVLYFLVPTSIVGLFSLDKDVPLWLGILSTGLTYFFYRWAFKPSKKELRNKSEFEAALNEFMHSLK